MPITSIADAEQEIKRIKLSMESVMAEARSVRERTNYLAGGSGLPSVFISASDLPAHNIVGDKHFATGQVAGQVIRATGTGANDFSWQNIQAGDLPVHNIVGAKHSVTGSADDLVGLTATNTLGLLIPTFDGHTNAGDILKTSTGGELAVGLFRVGLPASGPGHLMEMRSISNANLRISRTDLIYSQIQHKGGVDDSLHLFTSDGDIDLEAGSALVKTTASDFTVGGDITFNDVTMLTSKAANLFFGSPSGGAGAPTFRVLATSDLPTLPVHDMITSHSATAWRMFYSNASAIAELAFGTSGKVLTSGGASAAPTWETPTVGSHVIATTAGLGADHTTSGLTAGQVLRATGATTAAFQSIVAGDLPVHDIITSHSETGLTVGQVIKATGTTTFQWGSMLHTELASVLPDQHHGRDHAMTGISDHSASNWRLFYSGASGTVIELPFGSDGLFLKSNGASSTPSWATPPAAVHDIVGASHTITASALDLVGATSTNTLGIITPSAAPGAASAVLKTTAAGLLTLVDLKVSSFIYGIPAVANTFLDFDGSGGGAPTLASAGSIAIAIDSNNSGTSSSLIIGHNDTDGSGGGTWADLFVISETLSRAYKNLQLRSAADLILYSDDGTTEVGRWDGATGDIDVRKITLDDRILHDGDVDTYIEFPFADDVSIIVGGTLAAEFFEDGVGGGYINFADLDTDFGSNNLYLEIAGPTLYLNDNVNSFMTSGFTINQGANDNEILAGKSSDIAHGMTGVAETDTYFSVHKISATAGGMNLRAFSEATNAYHLQGGATTGSTTKSTAGQGNIMFSALKKSGTSWTTHATNENLFVVRTGGLARFIVDAEGDVHLDGTTNDTAWDEEQDTDLLRTLSLVISDPASVIRSEFDELIKYNKNDLIRMGILSEGGFINWTQTWRVMLGALWQQGIRIQQLEEQANANP